MLDVIISIHTISVTNYARGLSFLTPGYETLLCTELQCSEWTVWNHAVLEAGNQSYTKQCLSH